MDEDLSEKALELDRGRNGTGKELAYLELGLRARHFTDTTVYWVG